MIKTIIGRYFLFAILGVEALLLPYFLSKEVYGEVEFYKFTAFLVQFLFFGAGTGYVVRYIKKDHHEREALTRNFIVLSFLHAALVSCTIFLYDSLLMAVLAFFAMLAMAYESIIKVKEKYLLAMSFKPILSLILICSLPLLLIFHWRLESYVALAFGVGVITYIFIAKRSGVIDKIKIKDGTFASAIGSINMYLENIRAGFIMNAATAMLFVFFYIDRAVVRESFPKLLGDYSLSYSIMQLTIVAITTFSYVNLVEFGKDKVKSSQFRDKLFSALKKCFLLYLVIGCCSVIFAYGAQSFYGYDKVFETVCMMVGLYGFANVLTSLNAAHLYLGTTRIMTAMMTVCLMLSVVINQFLMLESVADYYWLLGKSYGLFLVFSVCSFVFIVFRLKKLDCGDDA